MGYTPPRPDWNRDKAIIASVLDKELQKKEKTNNKVKGIILISVCILILFLIILCFVIGNSL